MIPKPKHLEPKYGAQFKDESIVDAYRYRPPYPEELFDILGRLITSNNKSVLDIGCGSGNLVRRLINRVDRIDAVDFSQAMIELGKNLPGGDHPNLRWIHGPVEDVPLSPPYGLITAAQSLHWMAWDVVFPRFQKILAPGGYLAIVGNRPSSTAWDAEIGDIIRRYSFYSVNRRIRRILAFKERPFTRAFESKSG
jgi:trans-aconitate methyltransferase